MTMDGHRAWPHRFVLRGNRRASFAPADRKDTPRLHCKSFRSSTKLRIFIVDWCVVRSGDRGHDGAKRGSAVIKMDRPLPNLHRKANRPILELSKLESTGGDSARRVNARWHGHWSKEGCAMQHKRYGYGLAAAVAAALVVSACSNAATDTQASSTTSVASTASASAASSNAAHNDVDVAFAQGMIPHHQQAVEMSDMILDKQGIDPQIVSLANQIKNAQGPEIEQLQGWLQEWGASTMPAPSSSGVPGHDMPGHDMSGGDMGQMPGMAGGGHGMMSEADMAALQNAQGAEAGRLFLSQMIEHHEGAVTMAQPEIDSGQFPAAVDMARAIVSTQQEEIATMQGLLDKQ